MKSKQILAAEIIMRSMEVGSHLDDKPKEHISEMNLQGLPTNLSAD